MTLSRRRVIRRTWNRIHCLLWPAYLLIAYGFGLFLAAVTH
jgi:hypothetical protein